IEPRILLLDEPFGALDAKVRKELRKWLRTLHEEIHVTSIFVTHDQEEELESQNGRPGPSKLFIRRHDFALGPAGSGALEGAVTHVRAFGPTHRADILLNTAGQGILIEIDAPRDRDLKPGDIVGLQPRRYRIFAAQD